MIKLRCELGFTLCQIPKIEFGKTVMRTAEDIYRFETLAERKLGMEVSLFEFHVIGHPWNTLRLRGPHKGLATLLVPLATGLHWSAPGLSHQPLLCPPFLPLIYPQGSSTLETWLPHFLSSTEMSPWSSIHHTVSSSRPKPVILIPCSSLSTPLETLLS